MRKIVSILIILIFAKQSYALDCLACEATDTEDTCELSYKCPKGAKYCETLVSKVEGSYSVVMSCATEEKCEAEAILEGGLDECRHDKDNTECYSCCKGDDCNTLEAALKELPDDIFESEKSTKKGKKNKGKKADDDDDDDDDDEQENKEKIDEKEDDNNDEEDKDVKGKKEEKKKSKKKDKKSKSKEEDSEKEENTDDKNPEDPEEEKSAKNEQDDKKVDNSVASSNETSSEVTNESPENGTVEEKMILNDNNQTVVATNITAKATEEGTGNNNNTEEVIEPLDPNIQEIDKKLNETVDVVEEFINNFDNAGNAENVENNDRIKPKDVAENSTNILSGLEETKVEDGSLYKSLEDEVESGFDGTNNDPNIINQGENADEIGEQHELNDAPSSSTKYQISEILLLTTSIIILVQFF